MRRHSWADFMALVDGWAAFHLPETGASAPMTRGEYEDLKRRAAG